MMKKYIIPLAAMGKLILEAGDVRVSLAAKHELNYIVEEKGIELARKAIILAQHANRDTIKKKDIIAANKI